MMSVFSLRDELILKYNFDELRHEVLLHLWAGQRFLINQTRDLHSLKTHWTAPTSREWNGPHFRMFRLCKQGSNRSGTASVVGFVISCVDLESYYWADEHRKMFSDAWAERLVTAADHLHFFSCKTLIHCMRVAFPFVISCLTEVLVISPADISRKILSVVCRSWVLSSWSRKNFRLCQANTSD